MRWRATIIAALLVCSLTAGARAQTQVSLTVGWQNFYRPGRWTPIYVTASDPTSRDVDLELYAPSDQNYAINVRQRFTIGPTAVTHVVYAPLTYALDSASIKLIDANSGRTLATAALEDYQAFSLAPNQMLIGISGNDTSYRLFSSEFGKDLVKVGFVSQLYLPRVPVGYDGLDLLILVAPDFNRLEADQQRAIVQWVRTGGLLVLIPGAEPLPPSGPLMDVLPVKLGENRTYTLPAKTLTAAGLPQRFASLKGRAISAVAEGATPVKLFDDSEVVAYRQWLGYGQIMVIPADTSMLVFESPKQARAFRDSSLKGMTEFPAENEGSGKFVPPYHHEPRQQRAMEEALNWIGDVPGAGSFGFSYLAMALMGMMLVVGPVDWFVLKWIGKQPWTWVTTTGWIGLITLGAIYAGHLFKSGDLHFRSVTLFDEAQGMRVAQRSIAGIYSPRTRDYQLTFEPESWWKPASNVSYGRSKGLLREIDCKQDYRGNRPESMLINVWNLRFLTGEETTASGAVIVAKLSRRGDALSGSITNQGEFALSDVVIRTGDGPLRMQGRIEPGATMQVAGKIDRKDDAFTAFIPSAANQWQGQPAAPSTRPTLPAAGDVAVVRTDRIDQMLRDRKDVAVVYADFDAGAKSPGAKLDEPESRQAHIGMIRSLIALEGK